jgi:hypothetical protein
VTGSVLALGLVLVTSVGCLAVHAGSVFELAFPVLAVGVAIWLLRVDGAAYVTFVVWMWLLTPEVRRLVDYGSHFHEPSTILATAPILSLAAIVGSFTTRRRVANDAELAVVVTVAAMGFGLVIGLLRGNNVGAITEFGQWATAPVFAFWLLAAGPSREVLRPIIERLAIMGLTVTGLYAVYQYFVLSSWDRFWMIHVRLASIGQPLPHQVRVFSTLNAPGPYATVTAFFLAVALVSSSRWRWLALAAGTAGLGLSLVRAAWLGFALALLLIFLFGWARHRVTIGLALLIPAIALVLSGSATHQVTDRFSSSASAGVSDQSLTARIHNHEVLGPLALRQPIGLGLGSTGSSSHLSRSLNGATANASGGSASGGQAVRGTTNGGSRSGSTASSSGFSVLDSGLLEPLLVFGTWVGLAYLLSIILAIAGSWSRARTLGPIELGVAAGLVGIVAQIPFGDVLISVSGLVLWLGIAYLGTSRRDPPLVRS